MLYSSRHPPHPRRARHHRRALSFDSLRALLVSSAMFAPFAARRSRRCRPWGRAAHIINTINKQIRPIIIIRQQRRGGLAGRPAGPRPAASGPRIKPRCGYMRCSSQLWPPSVGCNFSVASRVRIFSRSAANQTACLRCGREALVSGQ